MKKTNNQGSHCSPTFHAEYFRSAISNSKLPTKTRLVLMVLCFLGTRQGEIKNVLASELAQFCGCSTRFVCKHMNVAKKAGWIVADHLAIPEDC